MSHFPQAAGFSPGVRVGALIHIAGQFGRDSKREPITDPEQQIVKTFDNVELVLREAGDTIADVVEVVHGADRQPTCATSTTKKGRYYSIPTSPLRGAPTMAILPTRSASTGCCSISPIDECFGLRFGELPYRSLDSRYETVAQEQLHMVAAVSHPDCRVASTAFEVAA